MLTVKAICQKCGKDFYASYAMPLGYTGEFNPAELCEECEKEI